MTTKRATLLVATGLAAAAGCATASPPTELLTARQSYRNASAGQAAKYDPADLHTAKKALDAAEHSFTEDGSTQVTKDLAYTADRRALIAEARGSAKHYTKEQQATIEGMHADQTTQVRTMSAQLGDAKEQLALQGQELETQGDAIVDERTRREDAEKKLAQAMLDISKFASVKQEPRGMVITLSGGVLFESAKSALLPAAELKLNSVADSLAKQDPDSKIVVEGHTDSQGGANYNQTLSQQRAETVRTHLISRGIADDRVTAQGFGLTRSIADNASAEGRANNRRVEIVVQPQAGQPQ
jgi:outer membrane protein OmpA-like peptidoglycan-associated protein